MVGLTESDRCFIVGLFGAAVYALATQAANLKEHGNPNSTSPEAALREFLRLTQPHVIQEAMAHVAPETKL
jgi:hypothetical protein